MAGKNLVSFADFVLATTGKKLSSPEEILNDATKTTYGVFSDAVMGRSADHVLRGGKYIFEQTQLTDNPSLAEFYSPGSTATPTQSDSLTEMRFDWAFARTKMTWTEQEVELNEGDREAMFTRILTAKENETSLSLMTLMENGFISDAPDVATMETTATSTTIRKPYCIRAIINESGIVPGSADAAVGSWTTLGSLNPTTYTNYRNPFKTYKPSAIDTQLSDSFGDMYRALNFKSPKTKEDYFTDENFRKIHIWTSGNGQKQVERICRLGNDDFKPGNDFGAISFNPMFRGLPIEYIAAFDTCAWTDGSPRYFWPNFKYMYPVFHPKKYMVRDKPFKLEQVGQPETWVCYTHVWYQWVWRSRRHSGIIIPN